MVICHCSQDITICVTQGNHKIQLCEASPKGDGFAVQEMVGQHLGDSYRGEEDVNKGEIGKEKIHGVVKVNVRANGQDDEQVSDQCDGVNEQEEDEEEVFLLLLTTDSQENETKGKGLVVSSHGSFSRKRRGIQNY